MKKKAGLSENKKAAKTYALSAIFEMRSNIPPGMKDTTVFEL